MSSGAADPGGVADQRTGQATGLPTCSATCTPSKKVCLYCGDGTENNAEACDGAETDVDCGGTDACARCKDGKACLLASDCLDQHVCVAGLCSLPVLFQKTGQTLTTGNQPSHTVTVLLNISP